MERKYFYNINFLRFIFAVSILLLHFTGMSLRNLNIEIPRFADLANKFSLGYICVDYFFIISGFLLAIKYIQKDIRGGGTIDMLNFSLHKIVRLMPPIYFGIIMFAILSCFNIVQFNIFENIECLFLLTGLGITSDIHHQGLGNLHPAWFVSTLFWVMVFYQYLFNNFSKKSINLFVVLSVILGYGIITTSQNGVIGGRIANTYFGLFNLGILRGLCGIGLGYCIANFYNKILPYISEIKLKFSTKLILSFVQLSAVSFLIYSLFIKRYLYNNDIFYILLFTIIFFLMLINKDYISRLFDNKYLSRLGIYSYSIYVMHALCMDVFVKLFYNHNNINILLKHPDLYTYIAIVLMILTGIATYYMVEKPIGKFLTVKVETFKENKYGRY